jgi:uncharacterized protein (TIGR03000 family)
MFRKVFAFGGVLALSLVLATAGPVEAQHHGGGAHFGGAHFGGAHFGGAHFGGAHFGGAHFGGVHFGGYHSGYHYGGYRGYSGGYHYRPYYGYGRYNHYRYPYGGSYGYYPYYGSYGYYPYYNDYPYYGYYGYYPSAVYDAPYYWSGSADVPDYDGFSGDVGPAYTGAYASGDQAPSANAAAPTANRTAHVTVKVPAGAVLSFNGYQTTSAGPVREFDTPPLAPGRYTYEVQARWQEDGYGVTQEKQVVVTPGARLELDFPIQHPSQGKTAAAK